MATKNREIAQIFKSIGEILELKGDSSFRVNSYYKASRVIGDLSQDIEKVAAEGKLRDISGIGEATAKKIEEYLETGRIGRYEELKKDIPADLIRMMEIPGLGPKTVNLLWQKLGVTTMTDLRRVMRSGQAAELPGMGEKKVQNILKGIELYSVARERMPLGVALPIAQEIAGNLRKLKGVKAAEPAGSLRRKCETIGDIDILTSGTDGAGIIKAFTELSQVKRVLAAGDTKGSVILEGDFQIDVRVVPEKSFGAALQYFTGSKAHNIRLRGLAKTKGLKVSEYGVFKGKKSIAGKDEEEVYEALGLPWMPPELREDRGEIAAAQQGRLPDLIELEDIKGDLQVHSTYSDGSNSIEEMALAAKKRGYKYICITDHSRSLKVASGLEIEELEERAEEIARLNKKLKGIRILNGAEVDILGDGRLDYPDEVLEKLDIVLGAIHSALGQEEKKMTARLLSAIENPNVDIIAHPTGRVFGQRGPSNIDLERIMKAAAETKTVLEIDAYYDRLDLNDINARMARDMGVKLEISTDAHHIDQLWMMELGVAVARRGWLTSADVINTLPADKLLKWIRSK